MTGPPDGLFAGGGFGPVFSQLIGVLAAGGYALVVSLLAWGIIKAAMGAAEAMGQGGIPGAPSGGVRAASYASKPVHA